MNVITTTEEISKLIEQKANAYAERNKVAAALAHLMYSMLPFGLSGIGIAKHQGADWDDDWRTVLVITTINNGQITWHFHDSEKHLLEGLPVLDNYQYDGHTTDEKYQRLFDFVGIKNN